MFRFVKIFPTASTHVYHEFFEAPRYYNMMFDAWETKYSENRQEGIGRLIPYIICESGINSALLCYDVSLITVGLLP
jgi:hypothetical protein